MKRAKSCYIKEHISVNSKQRASKIFYLTAKKYSHSG